MTNTRGYHRKYIVKRVDDADLPGNRHYGCSLFVLDLTHDAAARKALEVYAAECFSTKPELTKDLRALLDRLPAL